MRTKKESAEVVFADEDVRVCGPELVREVAARATENPSGKARVCLHRSPDAALHEMLVALRRDVKYPPHRNKKSEETHFVLSGTATLLLYREDGAVSKKILLGDTESGRPGYSRIPENVFHCLEIESDVCVFLETKLGPFNPGDNETAAFKM